MTEAEWSRSITVEDMYGDWDFDAAVAAVDRSLHPRRAGSIFDTLASLGLDRSDAVLDIGGRSAFHSLIMAERFGCRVLCVDPAPANIEAALQAVANHASGHLVDVRHGRIEQIPAGDDEFGFVFSRDMMSHVERLDAGLAECARVLTPGGLMVIHGVFATDAMEPLEADRLYADLAVVPERMSATSFEDELASAGFVIEDIDLVGSEWYEANQEAGTAPNYALQVSRLRRAKSELLDELGEVAYRSLYGNALWSVYLLIGKLETRLYVLRLRGQ